MPADGQSHIRIARPSRDLAAAERFWCAGLGLSVVYRAEGGDRPGEHDLLMVGWPDASWHLELVHEAAHPVEPRPAEEDLLVIYLDEAVPEELVTRLTQHGGTRVASPNPYWNEWGVTIEDPDGYRLVLCRRGWSNS
ncbi:VOC family protein [Streptomyces malaysiensis subsp. malaysiensis]|uniref:VOC family protein n=1 Tax=Streptomyces malaysiensis TaxID=92644 RepID=UPI000BFB9DB5|nr:VOC family protein [Streptomyces malaysiensis]ATL82923.1 glyoxalase/bleomycin resistance protein/dioxygenase [Streptomyces malaysiensis]QDL72870.1 VOC family protein [Streptomyces malaysiensis]